MEFHLFQGIICLAFYFKWIFTVSAHLLLVCKNKLDFYIVISNPKTLVISCIVNVAKIDKRGNRKFYFSVSIYIIMSSANKGWLILPYDLYFLYFLYHTKTCNKILDRRKINISVLFLFLTLVKAFRCWIWCLLWVNFFALFCFVDSNTQIMGG